jgi:5-methylcytosine-specific restriction endonuclease McrA
MQVSEGDEEWVRDSAANWFVFEDGKCVYPPGIDYELFDRADRIAAYEAYLRSPKWREKRIGALRSARHECEECGATSPLHVHHRNYDRVGGNELPADLQVLCESCHYAEHHFAKAFITYLYRADTSD